MRLTSIAMASDAVTDQTEDTGTWQNEDGVLLVRQLEEVDNRLMILSERIINCDCVLQDLKDLRDILVRKSLTDVTVTTKK